MFSITISGCTTLKNEQIDYADFVNSYKHFKQTYNSERFELISPTDLITVTTNSLPLNKIDSRKTDTIKEDMQKPTKLELFYKSKDFPMLVQVNFIYSTLVKGSGFISINTISNNRNDNIISQYHSLIRPNEKEFLLAINGVLIELNFLTTRDITNEEEVSFSKEIVQFYTEIESVLMGNIGDI